MKQLVEYLHTGIAFMRAVASTCTSLYTVCGITFHYFPVFVRSTVPRSKRQRGRGGCVGQGGDVRSYVGGQVAFFC